MRILQSAGSKINMFGHITISRYIEKRGNLASLNKTIPTVTYGSGNIMLCGCFSAGGTPARYKIDGITNKDQCIK